VNSVVEHTDKARHTAAAIAGTNIALVKYWGKRDAALNLPAAGSLSLTLDADALGTRTRVRFAEDVGLEDKITLFERGIAVPANPHRIRVFLDQIRARAGLSLSAEVTTHNSVPTASGLASSASGFAALAVAASQAAGLSLSEAELSALARQGSGSAARSVAGGFVEMAAGQRTDGHDAFAVQIQPPEHWPVCLVVAIASVQRKAIGSTEAMNATAQTSPYYTPWVESVAADLAAARAAIERKDLPALGVVTERSCLRMHACALAADPGILYWNATTIEAMAAVKKLRTEGLDAYFTIDAGPHVKVLCLQKDADQVTQALARAPGVVRTLVAKPGSGVRPLTESDWAQGTGHLSTATTSPGPQAH